MERVRQVEGVGGAELHAGFIRKWISGIRSAKKKKRPKLSLNSSHICWHVTKRPPTWNVVLQKKGL